MQTGAKMKLRFLSSLVLAISVSWVSPAAGQTSSSAPGISLSNVREDDGATLFTYTVNNPDARYGLTARMVVDVAAPASAGAVWLGTQEPGFVIDALATHPGMSLGHVPLALNCPEEGNWIFGVDTEGEAWCEVFEAGFGTPAGMPPGRSTTFTIRAEGIPFLRTARMIPWRPLQTEDPDGTPGYRPFPTGVPQGVDVETVVAGPGLMSGQITLPALKAQVQTACQARLISTRACEMLPGLVDSQDWRRALGLLGDGREGGASHPLVQLTVGAQIADLMR